MLVMEVFNDQEPSNIVDKRVFEGRVEVYGVGVKTIVTDGMLHFEHVLFRGSTNLLLL